MVMPTNLCSGNHVNNDLDKAYAFLNAPRRNITDLEAALQTFSISEVDPRYQQPSLRREIYWGLMAVEKELSGYDGYETPEKLEHIKKAQRHCIEVGKIVSQSSDASLHAQVLLEQHFIEGRKAILDFKVTKDKDKLKRSMLEAKSGIDISLGKLHEIDRKSYDENFKPAMWWREKFSC